MRAKKTPPKQNAGRIDNPAVNETFAAYPKELRKRLLAVRQLILDTAADTPGVGKIEETLKWSEPAYLTAESKSGTTIRINRKRGSDSKYSMYFNCNTNLIDTFRGLYPKTFCYRGDREIEFDLKDKIPQKELQVCISMALTYHRNKKK